MSALKRLIADDFRALASGVGALDETKIDQIVETLLTEQDAFPANGELVSMIFYLKFKVWLTNPEPGDRPTFNGSGGGISSPGGGALFGDVYTDDLGLLTSDTVSFEFNLTPAYSSLLFFDSDSHLLGNFESASVSTVLGVGGGSGSWDTE
jgi:hypothetical protein